MVQSLTIRKSRKARYWLAALMLSSLAILLMPIPWALRVSGMLLVIILTMRTWHRTLGLGLTGSIEMTEGRSELSWAGERADIQSVNNGIVSACMISAIIRLPQGRIQLLAFDDAMPPEAHWQLRRDLRLGRWRTQSE